MTEENKKSVCEMVAPEPQENPDQEFPCLDRDQILQQNDLIVVPIQIPEWKSTVYVRMMTGEERDIFEETTKAKSLRDFRAKFAASVLCDKEGNLLFTKDDIPLLTKKSASSLERILIAGTKLNKISDEDVDYLVKNLEGGQSAASGTS